MKTSATSVEEYLKEIPEDKKEAFHLLRKTILDSIPEGFREEMSYGMIGYVVPHSIYSNGYHCNTKLPLPFISLAYQKNFISFYHMGLYAIPKLLEWFTLEYHKLIEKKADMGKSCIRFKNTDQIPFSIIAELVQKITVQDWVDCYESQLKK